MLTVDNTTLVVVDIQEKLVPVMSESDKLVARAVRMVKAASLLALPVVVTEQIPEKIGQTLPELSEELENYSPIGKSSFGCLGEPAFLEALKATKRPNVLLIGIESHVCVYQTARQLLDMGYQVHIVIDAISSRSPENKQIAVQAMTAAGAVPTCTETVLFELLQDAKHEKFRDILKLVK